MIRKYIKRTIGLVVITLSVFGMLGEGYATGPEVTLVINPTRTEISAGSEEIAITVDASGANLDFTWELSGPGKLEGEGPAAFYSPPEKIEQTSEFAIITVTVKEPSGQVTVKSVTLTILPSSIRPPIPSPVATPSEKKKMSKGTITALGLGAAAALGGGIALVAGGGSGDGGDGAKCEGVTVGGYCWYLGAEGQSCTEVCASHAGYHEATRTYAGSDGTDANCWAVLVALGAPADADGQLTAHDDAGMGCKVRWNYPPTAYHWVRDTQTTLPDQGSGSSLQARACACRE